MRNKNIKPTVKVIAFILIAVVLCGILNPIFQPEWYEWNNYDTINGFYSEPEDTIETIFLGTSLTINSIIPTQLYEEHGICAYNLGTEFQPMLASYYWLEEAYRLHPKTLKTVVLNMSALYANPSYSHYRKAFDGMRFSNVKLQAIKASTQSPAEALEWLLPIASYHERWTSLSSKDFNIFSKQTIRDFVRGYNFSTAMFASDSKFETVHEDYVSDFSWDTTRKESIPNSKALHYFEKIVSFCESKNLHLTLIQTPRLDSSDNINAIQNLAEKHNITFLPFCYDPLIYEIKFNLATDTIDDHHLNYYGAKKLTSWLGQYLVDFCDVTDIRGDARYAHMEKQLEEFNREIKLPLLLDTETDPVEYLYSASQIDNTTIFIIVKDEATQALRTEQRNGLYELGLSKLSALEYQDPYLGIIENGKVVFELSEPYGKCAANLYKKFDRQTPVVRPLPIQTEGSIDNETSYFLKSGGYLSGNVASCMINDTEYAVNERGLNIVVYDHKNHQVIDSVCFDTLAASERESPNISLTLENELENGTHPNKLSEQQFELYRFNTLNKEAKDILYWKEPQDEELLEYIEYFRHKDNIAIFISVFDDASNSLNEESRINLWNMGFAEGSDLGYRDSYVAVINEGKVILEKRGFGTEAVYAEGLEYSLSSGGSDTGVASSIIIEGQEYSPNSRGFNIVIYDKILNRVVDSAAFDTHAVSPNPIDQE